MSHLLKKKFSKGLSLVLSVALLVSALPADLLGGIAKVQALEPSAKRTINVSDFTYSSEGVTSQDITESGTFLDSVFSVVADTNNKLTVDTLLNSSSNEPSPKTADGLTFAKRLKLNGSGSKTKRAVTFTAEEDGTLTVYAQSGSSGSDRALILEGASKDSKTALGASVTKLVYDVTASTDYYLYSGDSGINLYYLKLAYDSDEGGSGDKDDVSGGDVSGNDVVYPVVYDMTANTFMDEECDDVDGAKTTKDGLVTFNDNGGATITYNSHGWVFQNNATITIKVPGNSQITVGACQFNNCSILATSTSGEVSNNYSAAVDPDREKAKEPGCYDASSAADSVLTFNYVGDAGEVVLTVENGQWYVPMIKIEKVEILPSINVTPTISGKGMLGTRNGDYHKVYFTADDKEDVEAVDGEEAELTAGTTYTLVVKADGGQEIETLEATVDGKTTYTTGAEDAEVEIVVSVPETTRTVYNNFSNSADAGYTAPVVGGVLPNTGDPGILYYYGTGSGCTYDGQLRFRNGVILWLPIQDDTTRITYIQNANANNGDRFTHFGYKDSGYKVAMASGDASITIDDITDFIKTSADLEGEVSNNGKVQKYLPIVSDADVKLNSITLIEYNPANSVTVSGTLSNATDIEAVSFKNLDNPNAELVTAEVDQSGNYTATLRRVAGETRYAASVSELGKKIDDADNNDKFTLIGNDKTWENQDFEVVDAPLATVSGKLTGILAVKGGELGANLIPDNEALAPIKLTLSAAGEAGEYNYDEVSLEQGRTYTVELVNADDYEVKDSYTVPMESSVTKNFEATAKPTVTVSGKFVTSDRQSTEITKVIFTNAENSAYSYDAEVTDNESYEIQLREAEYVTSVTGAAGYTVFDHVSVKDQTVENDVYLQAEPDDSNVPYTTEVTVGEDKDYPTIAAAVDAISRMRARGTDDRVTIVLEEGKTYREQLVIDTPNITIQGNGAKITWYYGVGFSYYSAKMSKDENGKDIAYYDEAYAVDKYEKGTISQNPGHWGATVNLLSGAKGFAAENLTFENSLNRYVTDEELADGASANASSGVTARAKGIDVKAKAAKERACVLYIQADDTTYKDCNFISSQDTLYTGDNTENSYFVNCLIEGNTDYICGDGNAVFDECTLSMYGYSDQVATGSYIVANKAVAEHGYLFSDCKIVQTTDQDVQKAVDSYLARAWDAGTVVFLNTELESADMIIAVGYGDMNAKVDDAHYSEYNTHVGPDGEALDLSARHQAVKRMTAEEAAAIDMTAYFDGWKPLYFDKKVMISNLELKITAPVAGEDVDKTVTTTLAAAALGDLEWYQGSSATPFAGDTYNSESRYTAKVKVTLNEGYEFAEGVKVTVAGANSTSIEVDEVEEGQQATATVSAVFTTGVLGVYEIDLSDGLKKGVNYPGGISVMEDMPRSNNSPADVVDGISYSYRVQGANNPRLADGTTSPSGVEGTTEGTVPVSGAVLILDAEKDGKVTFIQRNPSGKDTYFVEVGNPDNSEDGGTNYFIYHQVVSANMKHTWPIEAGKKYYFYCTGSKVGIMGITVDYSDGSRGDWSQVDAPEITKVAVGQPDVADTDGAAPGEIKVTVKGLIGNNGADKVEVDMLDADNGDAVVDTKVSAVKNATDDEPLSTVTFTPAKSGNYKFVARLVREEETDKASAVTSSYAFVLPFGNPEIIAVTSQGGGTAKISWRSVDEATGYTITVVEKGAADAEPIKVETQGTPSGSDLYEIITGLEVGKTYVFSIVAHRGSEDSDVSNEMELTLTDSVEVEWGYTSYGEKYGKNSSDGTPLSGYKENEDGSVQVWATEGAGKIVPASTDQLAFYYTKVPADQNFKLTATVHADAWYYSNGQDGFGLLAADRLGNGAQTQFWNNTYMLGFTKVEYRWLEGQVTDSADGEKINMHVGPGALEKTGITTENLHYFTDADSASMAKYYQTSTTPLDTSMAAFGAGTYNIVDNYTYTEPDNPTDSRVVKYSNVGGEMHLQEGVTNYQWNDFRVTIEKNNTGYFLSFTNPNTGIVTTKKFYDPEALTQLDDEFVYVGLFAARNAVATFSDIELDVHDPSLDPPAETIPVTYYTPSFNVTSGTVANTQDYTFKFSANWAGTLTVKDPMGKTVINKLEIPYISDDKDADGKTIIYAPSTAKLNDFKYDEDNQNKVMIPKDADIDDYVLESTITEANQHLYVGDNTFTVSFAPNKNWHPQDDKLNQLNNYSTANFTHTVTYKAYGEEGQALYVAPNGSASNTGKKNSPLDIYTAVKYVQAGQSIILKEGTYSLIKTVKIERGIDGTADKKIYMIADPEATSRPVFDFNGVCAGMVFAGNYWYFNGFDVTGSRDGLKGIEVSGKYNVLENLHTYMNGNSGIQISGNSAESYKDWPAYNKVVNCTSYLNADAGFEDADGFAAKLTVGDGNEFDGCISAYNADDGWDLYSKVENGSIGQVTLNNCVTFKNGYVLVDANGKLCADPAKIVKEVGAGNGNGFKMGGESLFGHHTLKNSYSFYNKAKGIDSNSCPDIQVENSISFNNGNYNVAFYTQNAAYTNYGAKGLISYKTANFVSSDYNDHAYDEMLPVGAQREHAWLAAPETVKSEDYIKAYNALGSDMIAKFGSASSAWSDLKDSSEGVAAFKAASASLSTAEKDFVMHYMPGIASFGAKYYAAGADQTKLVADLEAAAESRIFGVNNYFFVAGDSASGYAPYSIVSGITADETWFNEATFAIDGKDVTDEAKIEWFNTVVERDEKGVIKLNILQLTDAAQISNKDDFGLNNPETKNPADDPDIPTTETSGNVTGGLEDEDTTGVAPGDEPANREDGTMEGLWIAFVDAENGEVIPDYTYTGTAIKPEIRVYHDTTRLTSKDYSVSYSNNVNAYDAEAEDSNGNAIYNPLKAPTIKVTGKGNYEGFITQTFNIKPVDLNDDEVAKPSVTKIYNGKAQTVIPTLTYNGKKLANKKDFNVTNNSQTAAGTYSIDVTAVEGGNYTGSTTVTFNIVDRTKTNATDISKAKISLVDKKLFFGTSYVYTGEEIEPAVSAIYTEKGVQSVLKEGEDFTVTYSNNVNVGTATVVVEGIFSEEDGGSGYYGSKTLTFKITPVNIKNAAVHSAEYERAASVAQVYQGQPVTFSDLEVGVMYVDSITGEADERILEKNKDYTITYAGNAKAGTASFTIKGKGNATGSLKKTFKITAYDLALNGEDVEGSITDGVVEEIAYAIGGAKLPVSVVVNGFVLKQGTDYTVSYKGNTKTGVEGGATVTVTGKNGFKGKLSKNFTVVKKDLSDIENPLTMVANDVVAKTSAAVPKTVVKIYDVNGKTVSASEYTLSYYVNGDSEPTTSKVVLAKDDVVTVVATAKPTSKNFEGEIETEYRVAGADIKSASLKAFDLKYYTGSAITLNTTPDMYTGLTDFQYKDKNGVTQERLTYKKAPLVYGEDYEIVPGSYENNTKAGTARVTIRGLGEYGGTKVITFKINKKIVNMAKATVTIDKEAGENVADQLVVRLNNVVLIKDYDYTVEVVNSDTVKIYGIASYGGVKTVKVSKLLAE